MEQEEQEKIMNYLRQFISFENKGEVSFPEIRNVVDSIIPIFYKICPQIRDNLKDAEEIQNFKQNIYYMCDGCKADIAAKISDDDTKDEYHISVYESFLPLFWSLCYFVLYTYDNCYEKKIQSGDYDGTLNFDESGAKLARILWEYGRNLKKLVEKWPEDCPKPEDGNELVNKANALFCYGMSFILYHEVGHLLLWHLGSDPSIQKEKDADDFAIEKCLAYQTDKPQEFETMKNGMVLALISICLLDPMAGGDDLVHPNTEDRLLNALNKMQLADENITWMIAAYGILIWFNEFKFEEFFEKEYDTPKSYFDAVISRFKQKLDR